MRSIFELCTPRDEVLQGELREDIFAARLKDVMEGVADPVYGDPLTFFENTYPTAGLRSLLNDALGKLTGSAAGKNSVIRLETAFGGGKTHNLIALYHVVSGRIAASNVKDFVDPNLMLPRPGEILMAGVVGSDLDPTVGISHPDGIKTFTIWGEIAYQLAGRKGYDLVRQSDLTKAAVGTGVFESLIGNRPALIMIDEIARHLRAASAVATDTGETNLAKQTVAALMSLLDFASSKERCLVVLTLASETDAFAEETVNLRRHLSEALKVAARQERVLTPTAESEISAIVTHRLFKHIEREACKDVFDSYSKYYAELTEKNSDLPQRCLRAEYQKEFANAYPFHPELLTTLNRKTATIPNFNQTRGALRLLAWTVRALWNARPRNTWLIHLHHIDLGIPQIAEDLTSRLDRPRFKQVIEADIVSVMRGMPAHAQTIDEALVSAGKPAYASRAATTILINSLTQGIASGIEPSDLLAALVTPDPFSGGDDAAVIQTSLEKLYKSAWFLEFDGHRYRFKTEPSLNKIIEDETAHVGNVRAKAEIDRRVKLIWRKGFFEPEYFPSEPANIEDDSAAPHLGILHFDAVKITVDSTTPPDLVKRIYKYSGVMQGFRKFQNNVLFLVADEDQAENMVQVTRRYLAIGRIVGDADRMAEFTKEQKDELKKALDATELDVRVAITRAYRYLYYPSSDARQEDAYLSREVLPAQDQGEVDKDQTNVILKILRQLKKVQTADEEIISALFVKSRAWDQQQTSMTTEDLRKAFARNIGLRILLDLGQLKKTIQNGVANSQWIYYDSKEEFGYDKDSPPPAWQISDDIILYTLEEARRMNIRIKGKWLPPREGEPPTEYCPVCGMPIVECTCGKERKEKPLQFTGQGAVTQAFQQVLDQCQEHSIEYLSRLIISISGIGKQSAGDLRALGLAIPQFGKGKFTIEFEVIATFQLQGAVDTSTSEHLSLTFKGGWDRYKRFKSLSDAFAQEAGEVRLAFKVEIIYENGIKVDDTEFLTVRDVLATLEVGNITLSAVPRKEATE